MIYINRKFFSVDEVFHERMLANAILERGLGESYRLKDYLARKDKYFCTCSCLHLQFMLHCEEKEKRNYYI